MAGRQQAINVAYDKLVQTAEVHGYTSMLFYDSVDIYSQRLGARG